MKNIGNFLSENFHVLVVKFPIYLNRRVFVMHHWAHFGYLKIQRFCMGITKTLIRLRICVGWFESSLDAHARSYGFSRCGSTGACHYENMPIQIYRKFYHQKMKNFQLKNPNIFHISAQNIDCGYSLEPPRRGGSNEYSQSMIWAEIRNIMYTPVNPSFTT